MTPGIVSSDDSGSHFHSFIDEQFVHFTEVEVSDFYSAILAVHLSATIPHGTNSMGDS